MQYVDLPLVAIKDHPDNPRRDLGDLTELVDSIKAKGILQPLVVVPGATDRGVNFLLIAGHRRKAAAALAGLERVPVIVRDDLTSRADQVAAMLTENLQRTDLTIMEEAFAYSQLELLGVKPAAIAKATGRSRSTIESRVALTRLPESVRGQVDDHQLSIEDALFVAKHADDEEIMAALEGAAPRNIRWIVEDILRHRKYEAEEASREDDVEDVEDDEAEDAPRRDWKAEREALEAERGTARAAAEISDKLRREHSLASAGRPGFWDGLATYTMEAIVAEQGLTDHALEMLGLEPLGHAGDLEDWVLATCYAIESRGLRDRVILLGHHEAQGLALPERSWRLRADELIAARHHLGYVLSDAEQAAVDAEEAPEVEQVAS